MTRGLTPTSGRPISAAERVLRALDAVEATEADLAAIKLWARLHLLRRRPAQREPARADVAALERSAFRRSDGLGWGLGWEWDAFGDGTRNAADAIYTFHTALAGLVLLEAAAALGDPRPAELARRAARTLLTRSYSAEGDVPVVWYSDQPADQLPHLHKHDVNALTMGLFARLTPADELWPARDRERMLGFLLAEQGRGLGDAPGCSTNWRYGPAGATAGGTILDRPSDLIHQCLILLGLQELRDARADVAVAAACADIVGVHFDVDGTPRPGVATRGVRGWGPPAALFVLTRQRGFGRPAGRIAAALAQSVDAQGRSSLAPADEPRAQAWYALALAASAGG